MTVSTSRAASTRPPSVARSIQKRRDKPYKTEQSRVVAKKRKLTLNTSYAQEPAGFKFLPVGTPDLAERCKELSRKRGLPVNVVNGKPVSKHAEDPEKISHHIHRIGYHFRIEVLQDACQELGYTIHRGRFVKEENIAQMNEQSKMARTLAKYGVHLTDTAQSNGQGHETTEQVRAAIKELFPKIPEEDLEAILKHAWEEGSKRVGTNSMLDLPRRVQLATIARIRHNYTDYDRLLRAFEWSQARAEVEPICLKKLIEWRGENDEEHDDELEEIVRETIVIDDDDDEAPTRARNGSEADDEDSAADVEQGYASDTSLEISHQPAAVEDLGAESHDERSSRFLQRHQQPYRNVEQRHLDVRQKIGIARQQLRNAPQPYEQNSTSTRAYANSQHSTVVRVHVPESPGNDDIVMIGGQMFRRAPAPAQFPGSPAGSVSHASPVHGPIYVQQPEHASQLRPQLPSPRLVQPLEGRSLYERPVTSIEPQDELRRKALASASIHQDGSSSGDRSRPQSPVGPSPGKRRRVGSSPSWVPVHSPTERSHYYQADPSTRPEYGGQTSPSSSRSPFLDAARAPQNGHYAAQRFTEASPSRRNAATYHMDAHHGPARIGAPMSYASHQPVHESNGARIDPAHHRDAINIQGAPAPVQYVPLPQHRTSWGHSSSHSHVQPQPRVVYVQAPRAYAQPMHGAPALVQQVPREVSGSKNWPPPAQIPMTVPATHQAPRPSYAPAPPPSQPQPQPWYPR